MTRKKDIVLFMLPYAGGTAYNLMPLAAEIKDIDIRLLEWPGRGNRIREPLLTDIEVIVSDLFNHVFPFLQQYRDFAVYGHSMGTTVGYLLIQKIFEQTGRYPLHFFVSGSGGPVTREKRNWHTLPGAEFWEKVKTLGGCPAEMFENPELVDFAEPILRADFEALGRFEYKVTEPMAFPITAFRGTKDEQGIAAFKTWQRETTYPLKLVELEGDHFFIFQHGPAIGDFINNTLQNSLQPLYAG
jgi:medium-chain acyl-[acyl-carrier-protein] hydrolase